MTLNENKIDKIGLKLIKLDTTSVRLFALSNELFANTILSTSQLRLVTILADGTGMQRLSFVAAIGAKGSHKR